MAKDMTIMDQHILIAVDAAHVAQIIDASPKDGARCAVNQQRIQTAHAILRLQMN